MMSFSLPTALAVQWDGTTNLPDLIAVPYFTTLFVGMPN
jgi:hypothetical protein